MGNAIITPSIFAKELIRNRDRKNIFAVHTNRAYEGELKKAGDTVRVQTLPTLNFVAQSITGAGNQTTKVVGTGPGQAITASDFAITLENLVIDKYAPLRITLTEHEMVSSNLSLTTSVAARFAEAEARLVDNEVRDQILVTQVADIPAANKINSASPVVITKANVYEEIMKLRGALKKQNVPVANMRLFVSTDVETVLLQSDFVKGSDAGVGIMKSGFIGTVGGVQVYSTTALDASQEMIMMAEGAVNLVIQLSNYDVREGTDGFYANFIAEVIWGLKIFGENAKAIAINYVASVS